MNERPKKLQKQEKKAKEQADKKAKLDAMMGGLKNSDGKNTGQNDGSNNKGNDNVGLGDAYGKSYYGNGAGDGGKGYGLKGRGDAIFSEVIPDCNAEGTVVVEVIVDRSGKVIKAIPGKKGTIADGCLYEAAKKTALSHKWQPDAKAPAKQIGFVVVKYGLGQ
jgi:TolA-binding protein